MSPAPALSSRGSAGEGAATSGTADALWAAELDVVVVTYQSARHVSSCLGALPSEAHVVVVDNASRDTSASIAAQHGARVICNPTNRGFAAAANQGARLGQAKLILFLNPDAVVAAADLFRLVEVVLGDNAVAVAGPRLVSPEGRERRGWWPFPSASHSWFEAAGLHRAEDWLRASGAAGRAGGAGSAAMDVPFVVGACFLVRRTAFEALGGFDEAFWLYGEEADFCRRVADAGWRVRHVPHARAVHVGQASAEAADESLIREHFCLGTDRFIRKHQGRAAMLSHRLALLAGSAARVALLAVRPDHPVAAERRALVRRQLTVLRAGPFSVSTPPAPPTTTVTGGEAHSPVGPDEAGDALRQVVLCSLEAWDETWRRNQFLVRELLAAEPGMRLLFVEPPHDALHEALRTRRIRRPAPGVTGLRPISPDGRLWALRPGKLIPRALGPWADRSLARQVRLAATTLGLERPTLWINDSAYAPMLRDTGWPALYDITDDWLVASCTPRERRRRQRRERELLAGAAVVVACSRELVRRRQARRPVRLIPNAVDVAHITDPQPRPGDLPPGPCAVYVGTLHEDRLDVDLVVRLARAVPAAHLVLVGPDALASPTRERLRAERNIHLLGARPYRDIPAYLQHADVVIVPHLVTPFTESLDPIKAYEILAVGRPAVATPVAGFRQLGPTVRCAAGSEFVEAVRQALAVAVEVRPETVAPQPVPSWSERGADFRRALRDAATAGRRLSVVYLDHCARLSGGEIALERLVGALDEVDAHVILAEEGPLRGRLEATGVECEVLPMAASTRDVRRNQVGFGQLPVAAVAGTAAYVLRLARRLRQLDPDLVHTNSLKAALYGSLAARLAGMPVVWHVHDRIAADYLPSPAVWVVRHLARWLPAAVIANSAATAETLGLDGRCAVVQCAGPAYLLNRRAAPPVAPFVIGMVGRVAPWKGQDLFLRAFVRAFPDGPERAVIVGAALFGEAEYESHIHALAEQLGVGDRVDFLGFREDVEALYGTFHILVHASRTPEPFGQVIVEAMAAGVPVVAAGAGGPLEIIDHDVSGLLFPPGDVEALAGCLFRLRHDQALRDQLSANGRFRAEAFTPAATAAKVLEIYRSIWESGNQVRSRYRYDK